MSMGEPGDIEEFAAAAMDDLGELEEIEEELGDWIYKSEGKIETLYDLDEYDEYEYEDTTSTKRPIVSPPWTTRFPMPPMPMTGRPRPTPAKKIKKKKN